jgi:hypothetical protein
MEIELENIDELNMLTLACEYPRIQDIINGGELKAFAQRPKPEMRFPEWMKEIEFENGNVKKQVIRLLNALRSSLFKT